MLRTDLKAVLNDVRQSVEGHPNKKWLTAKQITNIFDYALDKRGLLNDENKEDIEIMYKSCCNKPLWKNTHSRSKYSKDEIYTFFLYAIANSEPKDVEDIYDDVIIDEEPTDTRFSDTCINFAFYCAGIMSGFLIVVALYLGGLL